VSAAAVPASAWQVFRSRNFAPYFVGNAASASGSWAQNLAASVLLYQLTHSPFLLGVLNACQYGPVLLLAPITGVVADTFDRRRLLLVTMSLASCVSGLLAVLAWTGNVSAPLIIAFAGVLGTLMAISNPTQMALVGSLVAKQDLAQAVALNTMTFNLARAFGPAFAAGIIAAFGVAPAFLVNACSFLVLVAGLSLVTPAPVERTRRASMLEGVAIVRARPILLGQLAVGAAVSIGADPVNTESAALAHAFGRAPVWSGAFVGCFGAGAVAAARLLGPRARGRLHITLAALGLGMVLMALSPWLALGLAFLVVSGFGYLGSSTAAAAGLQLAVDESQRGRFLALWAVAFFGTRPLASLCDGAVASLAGMRVAAVVMVLPALAGAVVLLVRRRRRHG
jgi:MFS family permease